MDGGRSVMSGPRAKALSARIFQCSRLVVGLTYSAHTSTFSLLRVTRVFTAARRLIGDKIVGHHQSQLESSSSPIMA